MQIIKLNIGMLYHMNKTSRNTAFKISFAVSFIIFTENSILNVCLIIEYVCNFVNSEPAVHSRSQPFTGIESIE